jgi:hypothetical protein
MLLKFFLMPFWLLIDGLLGIMPEAALELTLDSTFFDLLKAGVYIMGADTFSFAVSSFLFWYSIQLLWAIIEWIYKKIPGVS